MPDKMKNVFIGLFVSVALCIIVFILIYLHPSVGDEKQVLYAWFSDIDKVNIGTRVTFAGKPVGEVAEIYAREDGRQAPADEFGRIYAYKLKLLLDSRVKVYDTDRISMRTSGLLGERSVAIIPILPINGEPLKIVTDKDLLYASESGSVEDTMREFKEVADKVEGAFEHLSVVLQEIHNEEMVRKFSNAAENVANLAHTLNKPDELSSIITHVNTIATDVAERLPNTWTTLDQSLDGFKETVNHTKYLAADAQEVMAKINRGEGTFGSLLARDDLYLQLRSVLSKADTVANDVNHYGLLFHSDKAWQRLRARRVNLMAKLSTPQEFRNYFNEEMDQINTSLARVYMLLEQTENVCPSYAIGEDLNFRKVFAELLRRADALEESLKLYNQQLSEVQNNDFELMEPCCH